MIDNMCAAATFYPGKKGTNGYTTPEEVAGGACRTRTTTSSSTGSHFRHPLNATLYNDWGQSTNRHRATQWTAGLHRLDRRRMGRRVDSRLRPDRRSGLRGHQQQRPVCRAMQPGTRPMGCIDASAEHDHRRIDLGVPGNPARILGLRLFVVLGNGQRDDQRRQHPGDSQDLQERLLLRNQRLDREPHLGLGTA